MYHLYSAYNPGSNLNSKAKANWLDLSQIYQTKKTREVLLNNKYYLEMCNYVVNTDSLSSFTTSFTLQNI